MTPEAIVAVIVGSLTALGLVLRALSVRDLERKVDAIAAKLDMAVIQRLELVEKWSVTLRKRTHDIGGKVQEVIGDMDLLDHRITKLEEE